MEANNDRALWEKILEKNVVDLPVPDMKREFDSAYQRDQLYFLAGHCGLSNEDIECIKNCECGGGAPHRNFFKYLAETGLRTEHLKNACYKLESKWKLRANAQSALEKSTPGELSELPPEKLTELADAFVEDPKLNLLANWRHVATELEYNGIDYNRQANMIAESRTQGGVYSRTEGLLLILQQKGTTIRQLNEVIMNNGNNASKQFFKELLGRLVEKEKNREAIH